MYQHPSDWHNNGRPGPPPSISAGAKRALAEEQGMGIILMRVSTRCGSWTSGVSRRLMAGDGFRRHVL
jgi:hypothetical protein